MSALVDSALVDESLRIAEEAIETAQNLLDALAAALAWAEELISQLEKRFGGRKDPA